MTAEKEMSLVGHLTELRGRIIWILLTFVTAMVVGLYFSDSVIRHIRNDPAAAQISWHVFGLSDALRIYMQVAFGVSVVLTLPVLLYHIWAFASPGLRPVERRALMAYIPFAFLLLLTGLSFGYYFLFPMILKFMTGFTGVLGAEQTYGITQYFQFMFNLVIPIGLLFELPVVMMFLTTIGIVKPDFLARFRKFAILLSVITASMITPPDLLSHLSAAVPLYLLYEISIWLSHFVYKRRLAALPENGEGPGNDAQAE